MKEETKTEKLARIPSLINEAACKRALIEEAQSTKFYWKQFEPRVSKEAIEILKRAVRSAIVNHVSKLSSKGKTI